MSDSSSSLKSAQQSLHYSLLSAFLKGTAKTPQMPENVLRIRALLRDPYTSVEHLSRVINSDPPLAAYLMQFADSPLLISARPCRTLRDVINRLGTSKLSNLVLSFAIRNIFISKELALQKIFRERWNASLTRAAWAACLTSLVDGISADDALLGGLFQDIGSLPLLAELENWPQFSREPEDLHAVCEALSGQIGSVILTAWKQPSYLIDCARQRNNSVATENSADVQLYELVQIAELLQNPLKHASLAELPLAQRLFNEPDVGHVQEQLKEQINLWFLMLGVKTRLY